MEKTNDRYFATLPQEEIGNALIEKVKKHYNHITSTSLIDLWRLVNRTYYSGYHNKGQITKYVENQAMRKIEINHFRNIIDNIIVKISGNKENYTPRARNSDHTSLIQTKTANIIIDYYATKFGMMDKHHDALFKSILYGNGGTSIEWDGEAMQGQGDIVCHTYGASDIIRDVNAPSVDACPWVICRQYRNKWDMIEKFKTPSIDETDQQDSTSGEGRAEKIKNMTMDAETRRYMVNEEVKEDSGDIIPVFVFYHQKTPAVPNGLRITFLTDGTVLTYDTLEKYKEFPFIPIECYHMDGTIFGYTLAYDLLPIEKAYNAIKSTITSNANAYGKPTVLMPEGCNLSTSQVMDGYKFVNYNPQSGAPQLLNLLQIPDALYKVADDFNRDRELISAINSVTRGNPDHKLSGTAYALLESKAIEYYSILDRNYVTFRQRTMTAIFETFKRFADIPRALPVVGKSNAQYMREISGEDVRDVCRIDVETSNPIERTVTGRLTLLESYQKFGIIKTPEQVVEVMTTGRIESATDKDSDELALAKKENEMLAAGTPVRAMTTDNVFIHLPEHKTLTNDPEIRQPENSEKLRLINDHISEHLQVYKSMDPDLAGILGMQPPPPPPQGEQKAPEMPNDEPKLPTNPLTGEEFNNQTGGLNAVRNI